MPLDFDNSGVDVGGVDDRRGVGGGLAIGGGAGVVGLIIYLLVSVLGGGDGAGAGAQLPVGAGGAVQGQNAGESTQELRQRCNAEGALQEYTDCRLIKVYNVANDVWSAEFQRRGLPFERPRLSFFSGGTRTGCGNASASVGPFYCPPDQGIFLDLGFLQQLQQQFGAQGQFAQAYIMAHEYGHHLQTLLGTEPKVRAAQQRNPGQANAYSVRLELQADCYAGVWSNLADASEQNGINLTQENIAEAVNAAGAVGDDRIQRKAQGRVSPESFTHGTAQQRQQWFVTGYRAGDLAACDTFAQG